MWSRIGARAALILAAALALQPCFVARPAAAEVSLDRAMLTYSFARATTEFYRDTADQVLMDGAISGMRIAIKEYGGNPALLPDVRSKNNPDADGSSLGRELD